MEAPAVVPNLDVFEDGCAGLGASGKLLPGALGFERAEEALDGALS